MDGRYNSVVIYKDSSSLSVIDCLSIRHRLSFNPVLTEHLSVIETKGWGPLVLQFRDIIGGWDQHSAVRVLMGGLGEMITEKGGV